MPPMAMRKIHDTTSETCSGRVFVNRSSRKNSGNKNWKPPMTPNNMPSASASMPRRMKFKPMKERA